MQEVWEIFQSLLGLRLDVADMNSLQMGLRTILIYLFTLILVRLGSKRFLAESTAFDVIVGIMLGSIMSRAINGSAPFVPTLVAGLALVSLHWLLGMLAFYLDWFGPLVKGNPIRLVKDGQILQEGMRKGGLSHHDLEQAIRLDSRPTDISKIHQAYLERNGDISVIPTRDEPKAFTVSVEEGVQTIRIEMK